MRIGKIIFLSIMLLSLTTTTYAGVLGACTSGGEKSPSPHQKSAQQQNTEVMPVPLPGQPAIDFELPAVVKNEIKTVKLSDFSGKYRVLCFFPAAFTFV
jgi:peroxiredoxin (alkyl hydroperoxide reductase subunit C)